MRTRNLILIALFAALTALCAQILIPLPFAPAPVNLALLVPLLAGRLFGMRRALFSQALYLCLGLFGLPVFTAFSGGAGVLFGPTGGYIIGYLLAAIIAGQAVFPQKSGAFADGLVMLLAVLSCYLCGTLWYMFLTGTGFLSALFLCVVPFIPGDALKIIANIYLVKKLLPICKNWA